MDDREALRKTANAFDPLTDQGHFGTNKPLHELDRQVLDYLAAKYAGKKDPEALKMFRQEIQRRDQKNHDWWIKWSTITLCVATVINVIVTIVNFAT